MAETHDSQSRRAQRPPLATLQVSYRFFKTNQLEFNGRSSIGNTVNTVKATSDLQGHLFEVGARYRF